MKTLSAVLLAVLAFATADASAQSDNPAAQSSRAASPEEQATVTHVENKTASTRLRLGSTQTFGESVIINGNSSPALTVFPSSGGDGAFFKGRVGVGRFGVGETPRPEYDLHIVGQGSAEGQVQGGFGVQFTATGTAYSTLGGYFAAIYDTVLDNDFGFLSAANFSVFKTSPNGRGRVGTTSGIYIGETTSANYSVSAITHAGIFIGDQSNPNAASKFAILYKPTTLLAQPFAVRADGKVGIGTTDVDPYSIMTVVQSGNTPVGIMALSNKTGPGSFGYGGTFKAFNKTSEPTTYLAGGFFGTFSDSLGTGTVAKNMGIFIGGGTDLASGVKSTDHYGLYIADQNNIRAANKYAMYYDHAVAPFVVNATGAVGIGVAQPAEALHIVTSAPTQIRLQKSGADSGLFILGASNSGLRFRTQNGVDTLVLAQNLSAIFAGAISAPSISTPGSLSAGSLSTTGSLTAGTVNTTGNLTAGSLSTTGSLTAGTLNTTGNLTAGSFSTSGGLTAGSLGVTGRITQSIADTTFAANTPVNAFYTNHVYDLNRNNELFRIHSNETNDAAVAFRVTTGGSLTTPTVTSVVVNANTGNVGIGGAATSSRLHVAGAANFTGTVTTAGNIVAAGSITGATVIGAVYQDLAEWVPASEDLDAGTVVVLDPKISNQVLASTQPYDTSVAGVVSTQPGVLLGVEASNKEMIATTGRVVVRADASDNPILIGDILVSSGKTGMAMKSVPMDFNGRKFHQPGTIIGKALEPLQSGTGRILVLLSLQ